MFTEKHFPTFISGEDLDAYLRAGWYRMGQMVFTTHFLFFEENLYSPVWTRLPLEGYAFRKSLRKILRTNGEAFRTEVRPASLDDEKEELFQLYSTAFKGRLSLNLREDLLDDKEFNIFDTWEVAVYDGGRLVACSFFDRGAEALAGIKSIHDPALASRSLGIYTMLREIQYGMERSFRHYYPGYFVPGYPRFDYKLRMGKPEEVEFFNLKSGGWQPLSAFLHEHVPVSLLSARLCEAGEALAQAGVPWQMLYYPGYEAARHNFGEERYLESPLFLHCFHDRFPRPRFIVFWDLWKEKFVFCHCMPQEDLAYYLTFAVQYDTPQANHFLDFLMKKSLIAESADAGEVARWARFIGEILQKPVRREWWK